MPSLSGLARDRMARRTVQLFVGDRGRSKQIRALATNLARLVDRSLELYQQASNQVNQWLLSQDSDRIVPTASPWTYLRAVSTFEDLVTSVYRACLCARALAESEDASRPQLAADDVAEIKEIRDAIQHTDDRILQRGRWKPISDGEPVFLRLLNDGLALGSARLQYTTLARVIETLHHDAQ